MLRIEGMNPHRIPHLRKTISQSLDRRDLRWFHTGMEQGADACVPPSLGNLVEVLIEIAKHDVTVTVNQCRSGWHNRAETRFQPILPVISA